MAHNGQTTTARPNNESSSVGTYYDDNQNIDDSTPDGEKVFFYKKRLEDLQADFDEFQFSSRELENELETQLSIYERKFREIQAKNAVLMNENETLRKKLEKLAIEYGNQTAMLQEKLDEVTAHNEQLTTHIRELEQSNDDLERAKRHLDATLSDFDAKLNEQIERNELLESEIGEKEQLQVVIQRLKDEARDLRLELMIQQNVKKTTPSTSETQETTSHHNHSTSSTRKSLTLVSSTQSSPSTTSSNHHHNYYHQSAALAKPTSLDIDKNSSASNSVINNNNTPTMKTPTSTTSSNVNNQIPLLSASSRISALNIVSDLLRKVGALESKLASCRNIMPVSSKNSPSSTMVNGTLKTSAETNNHHVLQSPTATITLNDNHSNSSSPVKIQNINGST